MSKVPAFEMMNLIFKANPPLPNSEFRVAMAIAKNLNRDAEMWHGLDSLAKMSGRHKTTVWRALKNLTEGNSKKGILPLLVKRPPVLTAGPGRRKSCTYKLIQHPAAFVAARDRAREGKAIERNDLKNRSFSIPTIMVGLPSGNGKPKKRMSQHERRQLIHLQQEREAGKITPRGAERLMNLEKRQQGLHSPATSDVA